MAEGQERTEQATPRRRKDAREKGQVARSFELTAMLSLLAGMLAFRSVSGSMVTAWQEYAQGCILRASGAQLTLASLQDEMLTTSVHFLRIVLPLLLALLVASLAANMLQVGILFSSQALAFDFSRMNPLAGIGRMFSMRAFVEVFKSMAKAAMMAWIIVDFFRQRILQDIGMLQSHYGDLAPMIFTMVIDLVLKTTVMLLIIAIADYAYQRYQFEKSLRMTKDEVKEEYKRLEGDPMVKGRIRNKQRAMARQRMMAAVPTATAVITNPTHLAIALRYDAATMEAPIVVAKGQRLVALRIKEIATAHGVPVIENKPLARALYNACELGSTIPMDLYRAVAEIIAFVMKQSGRNP